MRELIAKFDRTVDPISGFWKFDVSVKRRDRRKEAAPVFTATYSVFGHKAGKRRAGGIDKTWGLEIKLLSGKTYHVMVPKKKLKVFVAEDVAQHLEQFLRDTRVGYRIRSRVYALQDYAG